jgi:hypothetical protein
LTKEIEGFSLAQFGRALLDEAGIWLDLQPVLRVEIVKRSDDMKGFIVLPRRSVAGAPSRGSAETDAGQGITKTSPTA